MVLENQCPINLGRGLTVGLGKSPYTNRIVALSPDQNNLQLCHGGIYHSAGCFVLCSKESL